MKLTLIRGDNKFYKRFHSTRYIRYKKDNIPVWSEVKFLSVNINNIQTGLITQGDHDQICERSNIELQILNVCCNFVWNNTQTGVKNKVYLSTQKAAKANLENCEL